ncbi:MAG: hypothetical protein EXR29_09790 [Betaproteobacteria bacterium]|nr:hypothetical protein [Betaproteobacteria bacterium]
MISPVRFGSPEASRFCSPAYGRGHANPERSSSRSSACARIPRWRSPEPHLHPVLNFYFYKIKSPSGAVLRNILLCNRTTHHEPATKFIGKAEVLDLPAEDRARILDLLIASFEPKSNAQRAWMNLALRRREKVRSGKVAMMSGDEALARVRARIA